MSKKQLLIENATRLFYQKGIHAVGINEVLAETKVAKKTLYDNFTGKEELLLACLEYRHQRFMSWFTALLAEKSTINEMIESLFRGLHQWFTHQVAELGEFRGCFFIHTCAEFGHPDSCVNQKCKVHKQEVEQILRNQLMYFDYSPTQSKLLAEQLAVLKEGCIVQATVSHNANSALTALEAAKSLLNQK